MVIGWRRLVGVGLGIVLAVGCATAPKEQRTTHGPTAEQLWIVRMAEQNGRQPTFEERVYWLDHLDARIARYLAEHPEAANSFDVSTFRHARQVAVGMSRDQVLILLGRPRTTTTDAAEMEQLARRYWPEIEGKATEVWGYPLGWYVYFAGPAVVDITQYQPGRSASRASGAAPAATSPGSAGR